MCAPKYVCRLLPVPTDKIELKNSFRIRICSRYRRWQEAFKPKIKEFCRAFCDSLERANCFAFGARHDDKRKMGNILSDNIAFLNSVSLKIAFLAIARERAKKYNQQHTSAEANIYESSISETRMFEDYARARHTPTRQIRTALGTIPKHLIFVTYFLCKSRAIRCTNEVFLSVRSRRLHHPLARYSFHQSIASCMYTK